MRSSYVVCARMRNAPVLPVMGFLALRTSLGAVGTM
jgi:hypothetical protein